MNAHFINVLLININYRRMLRKIKQLLNMESRKEKYHPLGMLVLDRHRQEKKCLKFNFLHTLHHVSSLNEVRWLCHHPSLFLLSDCLATKIFTNNSRLAWTYRQNKLYALYRVVYARPKLHCRALTEQIRQYLVVMQIA